MRKATLPGAASQNTGKQDNYSTPPDLAFCQAMSSAGIITLDPIVADGVLHRFHIQGHKSGTKNGAYVLHGDGCPAGWFLDYTTGLNRLWKAEAGSGRFSIEFYNQVEAAKKQRQVERIKNQNDAADRAIHIWSTLKPAQKDHPYLVRKKIKPHGARALNDSLAIPLFDSEGRLRNLQFITSDGQKRFLSGGQKKGCFTILGEMTEQVILCEGFATGASLFEDSGLRVVISLDAGNLVNVARTVRRDAPPEVAIIIAGDNDETGVGQKAADEAARASRGMVMIPPVPGDWNDFITGGSA